MPVNQLDAFRRVPELTGASPVAETARVYVARAADTQDPVLISAEGGLDALAVCRAVHDASAVAPFPVTAIECARRSSDAFDRDIAAAPRGTIVFAHLEALSRSLQDRVAARLGTEFSRGTQADSRVMATVTGNVEDAIGLGNLSRELCMKFPIHVDVPSLRRRPADIPMLVAGLSAEAAAARGVAAPTFSREALMLLSALPWRRNCEELREVLDLLVHSAEGAPIQLDDVLGHLAIERLSTHLPGTVSLRQARHDFEREYIVAVLKRHGGRMDDAARALGVQRTNLYRKVRQLGIGRTRSK